MTRRPLRILLLTTMLALAVACSASDPVAGGSDAPTADAFLARELSILGSEESTSVVAIADGRPAVVNFWATWCEFCIDEMPDFEAVFQDFAGAVAFVGVDREDRVAAAIDLAAETGVTYPLVEDPDGTFFQAARGLGMPTTLFVTAEGAVAFRHSGPLTAAQLRELVDEHLLS